MPAKSEAQRRLFAVAEHAPGKLYARNRALGSLPHSTLHEFAATRGLGKKRLYGKKEKSHV
jgi:hypothetical protein